MSTTAVSNSQATMNLGVVTINNERYMAILHFRTDEGANRLVTDNMKKTRDVGLRLFQEVIKPYAEMQDVKKVNAEGFFNTKLIKSHEDLETQDAWKRFILHFESPLKLEDEEEDKLELKDSTHVELVDLSPLDEITNDKEFARDLYNKIKDAKPFPDLNQKEKLFLQYSTLYQYPQFLAGQHNDRELNNLFLESRQT